MYHSGDQVRLQTLKNDNIRSRAIIKYHDTTEVVRSVKDGIRRYTQ